MMTAEENDVFTRVGPGTPGGEMLRRYWHPVAGGDVLDEDNATHFVRVLGEDLVLFRDLSGRLGLIADRCAHRGCSLLYGRVEERGIACAYHGWLFDTAGSILETPPERNDAIMRRVRQRAYPVQRFAGLYWAYLGPAPAPVVPPFDIWTRRDGHLRAAVYPDLDCNWLQTMENSVDPAHLQILHQELINRDRAPVNTTRGYIDDVVESDFRVTDWGIVKHRVYRDGWVDEHPLVFPNGLRQGNAIQIRVPIDDTHTAHYRIYFNPLEPGEALRAEDEPVPVRYVAPYKEPPRALHPEARFRMDISVAAQDHMAWETQGPIANRTVENLSYSDRGVALFRRLLLESMDRVRDGLDPMGVMRDADHPIIDTGIDHSIEEMRRSGEGIERRSQVGEVRR